MKAILNFRFPRKQALSLALLFAYVVMPFAPLTASADAISDNNNGLVSASIGQAYTFTGIGAFSWTVPSGVSSIKVKVWGGGGAGGNGEKISNSNRSGLGGGAGGYAEKTMSVNSGDSYSINIGAGGQGIKSVEEGRVANSGGESRFEGNGQTIIASGGTGGASYTGGGNPVDPIGMGGAASGGDLNQNGGNGGWYSTDFDGNPHASAGGSAYAGGNGGANGRCGRDGSCPGSDPLSPWAQDGGFPGGGGGGSDVASGGFGAQGEVIVEVVSLASTNKTPIGWIDSASCDNIGGWAYDPDQTGTSIAVHFYTDGSGAGDRFIGSTIANISRADVNAAENISGDHGYNFAFPAELKDGQSHKIYAYGIDINGGTNTQLLGSPKEVTCSGSGTNTGAITASLSSSTACSAPNTPFSFTAVVSGDGVTSVVLEKDTNGDGVFGQVASYNSAGTYIYNTNEPSDYSYSTFILRLVVNGVVRDTKSVSVSSTCGGNTSPISATISPLSGACVVTDTNASFSINVSGSGINSVVLEKDTNGDGAWGQVASWTGAVASVFTTSEPAGYTGTYTLRLLVNGDVLDTKSISVASSCGNNGGNGGNNTPIAATLTTTSASCVAPGTQILFTATVSGDGVTSVVLEKDTNGDGSWGQDANAPVQTTSWTAPGIYTFHSNESSSYIGTYSLRLLVNDQVKDTKSIIVSSNCGGNNNGGDNTTPITASISTTAASCVAPATNVPFTITIAGSNITSAILEKDTNGDGAWGQVATYNGAGTYTFASAESSTYTGPYTLHIIVNGVIRDTKTVQVSNNCGGTTTVDPIVATLTTTSASCVAPGTQIPFTATVSGTGINTIVLEKDTNGDGAWGQDTNDPVQTTSWNTPGTYTFHSNEASAYTGTYALRLVVNGVIWDTKSITVSSNCGGNNGGGTTITPPSNTGGGGGHGGGGSGPCIGYNCPTTPAGGSGGSSTTIPGDILILLDTPTPSRPSISGPEKVCPSVNFIQTFLKRGIDNNPNEVKKLQYFLNTYEGANLSENGDFDAATEDAVKTLQSRHTSQILSPWGVSEPTGIVYLTTTRYINTVFCGDHPDYNGTIKDIDSSVLNPNDNSSQFQGDIGQATTTPTISSNIAGIIGALKDIPWYQILILLLLLVGGAIIINTAFKKDVPNDEAYMSLIRGAAILAVATVLNVLNTLSYILNPKWFVDKTGITLPWLLGLDAVNLGAIAIICLAVLISLYGRIAEKKN